MTIIIGLNTVRKMASRLAKKVRRRILVATVGLIASIAISLPIACADRRSDVIELLCHNNNLKINSFKLYGNVYAKPVEIFLNNPETLVYLTKTLQNPNKNLTAGWVCYALINVSNGKTYNVKFVIHLERKSFQIGVEKNWFDDEVFYAFSLAAPIPRDLEDAFLKMTPF